MPRVFVQQPNQATFAVDLKDGLAVGRHEQNTIVLADAKTSRQHAIFHVRDGGGYTLTDRGSTHGTRVNGDPITTHALVDGDRIQIGHVQLTYVDEGEPTEVLHRKPVDLGGPPAGGDDAARTRRLVHAIARAVVEVGDVDALLGRLLEATVDTLECERAAVSLGAASGDLHRRAARSRAPEDPRDVIVPAALAAAVLDRREGIIARDPSPRRASAGGRILCAMGAPLLVGARVFGLLYVDDRAAEDRFTERDLDLLIALAHLTAAHLKSTERLRRAASIPPGILAVAPPPPPPPIRALDDRFAELESTERTLVEEALKEARGSVTDAARLLGITRTMMKRRMERFGLEGTDPEG